MPGSSTKESLEIWKELLNPLALGGRARVYSLYLPKGGERRLRDSFPWSNLKSERRHLERRRSTEPEGRSFFYRHPNKSSEDPKERGASRPAFRQVFRPVGLIRFRHPKSGLGWLKGRVRLEPKWKRATGFPLARCQVTPRGGTLEARKVAMPCLNAIACFPPFGFRQLQAETRVKRGFRKP